MGFVYLVGNREHGWFKIGKSADPTFRIRSISINCPVELEVISLTEAAHYSELEAFLHARFKAKHLRGEWFQFNTTDIKQYTEEVRAYEELTPAQRKAARLSARKKNVEDGIKQGVRTSMKKSA